MALQLKQFREANEQRNNELKSIDELKTQVANLKMDLSAQSLIRLRRLAVVDDKLLKRQQQVSEFYYFSQKDSFRLCF